MKGYSHLILTDGELRYLQVHSMHISSKLLDYLLSKIKNKHGNKHFAKSEVLPKLANHNVNVDPNHPEDAVYLFNCLYSTFYNSVLKSEQELCEAVKCEMEGEMFYPGCIFIQAYADCLAQGYPIRLENFI